MNEKFRVLRKRTSSPSPTHKRRNSKKRNNESILMKNTKSTTEAPQLDNVVTRSSPNLHKSKSNFHESGSSHVNARKIEALSQSSAKKIDIRASDYNLVKKTQFREEINEYYDRTPDTTVHNYSGSDISEESYDTAHRNTYVERKGRSGRISSGGATQNYEIIKLQTKNENQTQLNAQQIELEKKLSNTKLKNFDIQKPSSSSDSKNNHKTAEVQKKQKEKNNEPQNNITSEGGSTSQNIAKHSESITFQTFNYEIRKSRDEKLGSYTLSFIPKTTPNNKMIPLGSSSSNMLPMGVPNYENLKNAKKKNVPHLKKKENYDNVIISLTKSDENINKLNLKNPLHRAAFTPYLKPNVDNLVILLKPPSCDKISNKEQSNKSEVVKKANLNKGSIKSFLEKQNIKDQPTKSTLKKRKSSEKIIPKTKIYAETLMSLATKKFLENPLTPKLSINDYENKSSKVNLKKETKIKIVQKKIPIEKPNKKGNIKSKNNNIISKKKLNKMKNNPNCSNNKTLRPSVKKKIDYFEKNLIAAVNKNLDIDNEQIIKMNNEKPKSEQKRPENCSNNSHLNQISKSMQKNQPQKNKIKTTLLVQNKVTNSTVLGLTEVFKEDMSKNIVTEICSCSSDSKETTSYCECSSCDIKSEIADTIRIEPVKDESVCTCSSSSESVCSCCSCSKCSCSCSSSDKTSDGKVNLPDPKLKPAEDYCVVILPENCSKTEEINKCDIILTVKTNQSEPTQNPNSSSSSSDCVNVPSVKCVCNVCSKPSLKNCDPNKVKLDHKKLIDEPKINTSTTQCDFDVCPSPCLKSSDPNKLKLDPEKTIDKTRKCAPISPPFQQKEIKIMVDVLATDILSEISKTGLCSCESSEPEISTESCSCDSSISNVQQDKGDSLENQDALLKCVQPAPIQNIGETVFKACDQVQNCACLVCPALCPAPANFVGGLTMHNVNNIIECVHNSFKKIDTESHPCDQKTKKVSSNQQIPKDLDQKIKSNQNKQRQDLQKCECDPCLKPSLNDCDPKIKEEEIKEINMTVLSTKIIQSKPAKISIPAKVVKSDTKGRIQNKKSATNSCQEKSAQSNSKNKEKKPRSRSRSPSPVRKKSNCKIVERKDICTFTEATIGTNTDKPDSSCSSSSSEESTIIDKQLNDACTSITRSEISDNVKCTYNDIFAIRHFSITQDCDAKEKCSTTHKTENKPISCATQVDNNNAAQEKEKCNTTHKTDNKPISCATQVDNNNAGQISNKITQNALQVHECYEYEENFKNIMEQAKAMTVILAKTLEQAEISYRFNNPAAETTFKDIKTCCKTSKDKFLQPKSPSKLNLDDIAATLCQKKTEETKNLNTKDNTCSNEKLACPLNENNKKFGNKICSSETVKENTNTNANQCTSTCTCISTSCACSNHTAGNTDTCSSCSCTSSKDQAEEKTEVTKNLNTKDNTCAYAKLACTLNENNKKFANEVCSCETMKENTNTNTNTCTSTCTCAFTSCSCSKHTAGNTDICSSCNCTSSKDKAEAIDDITMANVECELHMLVTKEAQPMKLLIQTFSANFSGEAYNICEEEKNTNFCPVCIKSDQNISTNVPQQKNSISDNSSETCSYESESSCSCELCSEQKKQNEKNALCEPNSMATRIPQIFVNPILSIPPALIESVENCQTKTNKLNVFSITPVDINEFIPPCKALNSEIPKSEKVANNSEIPKSEKVASNSEQDKKKEECIFIMKPLLLSFKSHSAPPSKFSVPSQITSPKPATRAICECIRLSKPPQSHGSTKTDNFNGCESKKESTKNICEQRNKPILFRIYSEPYQRSYNTTSLPTNKSTHSKKSTASSNINQKSCQTSETLIKTCASKRVSQTNPHDDLLQIIQDTHYALGFVLKKNITDSKTNSCNDQKRITSGGVSEQSAAITDSNSDSNDQIIENGSSKVISRSSHVEFTSNTVSRCSGGKSYNETESVETQLTVASSLQEVRSDSIYRLIDAIPEVYQSDTESLPIEKISHTGMSMNWSVCEKEIIAIENAPSTVNRFLSDIIHKETPSEVSEVHSVFLESQQSQEIVFEKNFTDAMTMTDMAAILGLTATSLEQISIDGSPQKKALVRNTVPTQFDYHVEAIYTHQMNSDNLNPFSHQLYEFEKVDEINDLRDEIKKITDENRRYSNNIRSYIEEVVLGLKGGKTRNINEKLNDAITNQTFNLNTIKEQDLIKTRTIENSFPATIKSVRPLGKTSLIVHWTVKDPSNVGGYEISIDGRITNRYYSNDYMSCVVFGVNILSRHILILSAVPKCAKHHVENANLNHNENKSTNILSKRSYICDPSYWTPSCYFYKPNNLSTINL